MTSGIGCLAPINLGGIVQARVSVVYIVELKRVSEARNVRAAIMLHCACQRAHIRSFFYYRWKKKEKKKKPACSWEDVVHSSKLTVAQKLRALPRKVIKNVIVGVECMRPRAHIHNKKGKRVS